MSPDAPITVQLCLDDTVLRRRVRACLGAGQANVQIVDAAGDAGIGDTGIDVIVADHVTASDEDVRVGRVLLGECDSPPPNVDAVLPRDFLDRELLQVCGLVARTARLRRQLQSGDTARRMLLDQALSDPTTTLPNRRGWDEALTQTLAKCRQRKEHLCVAVIDLDRFKRINDTMGHAAGDEVLRRVGSHLAAALRKDDVVARLGGDEFAVLLPGLLPENAADVVNRIRRRVSEVCLSDVMDDKNETLTASAGYVSVSPDNLANTDDADTDTTVLDAADRAMYEAKGAGRDCTRGGEMAPK